MIEVKQVELVIPTEPEEILLGQYQEYSAMMGSIKKEELTLAKTNEFVRMKLVSIFCNIPIGVVRDGFSIDVIDETSTLIIKVINELHTQSKEPQLTTEFTYHEIEFGFEPNFEKMQAGAFADLSSYYGEITEGHKVLAVLYRPILKRKYNRMLKLNQYELEPYDGTSDWADLMKLLPVNRLFEANFIIDHSFTKLKQCFLDYMQIQMNSQIANLNEEQLIALKKSLNSNGDGTKAFTELQDLTILKSLM